MRARIRGHTIRFLRWSERYTKTDMLYLAQGGFWLTLGHAVSVGASFALAIAFANLLPKEAYGTYKYILSVAGIVMALSLTGFKTVVVQQVAQGFEGILRQAFWTNLRWGIIMAAVCAAAATYYLAHGNGQLAIALIIIGLFSPLLGSSGLYSMFLNGKKDFRGIAVGEIADALVLTCLTLVALLFTDDPLVLVLTYFCASTATGLLWYVRTVRRYAPNTATEPSSLRYTKHLSAMNILIAATVYVDKILVFHYLGAAELAVYVLALAIPDQLRMVFQKNIGGLVLPKFSEKATESSVAEIRHRIFPTLVRATVVLLAVTALYIAAAPFLFSLFFPDYLESVWYSQLFSLSLVAVLAGIPVSMLQSQHKTKELYQFNLTTGVVQLGLLLVLVPLYGIGGALTAGLISRFFALGMGFLLIRS